MLSITTNILWGTIILRVRYPYSSNAMIVINLKYNYDYYQNNQLLTVA